MTGRRFPRVRIGEIDPVHCDLPYARVSLCLFSFFKLIADGQWHRHDFIAVCRHGTGDGGEKNDRIDARRERI